MQGKILFYDAEKQQGVLTDHEGKRYSFTQDDLRGETEVSQGMEVDFLSEDGESAQDIYIIKATAPAEAAAPVQPQVQNPHLTNSPQAEFVPCKTGGLFSPRGCFTRSQWWKVFLSLWAAYIFIWVVEWIMVSGALLSTAKLSYAAYDNGMQGVEDGIIDMAITRTVFIGLGIVSWFFIFWIGLVSSIKRFHDANLSGWMVLINLIPFVGSFIAFIINGFVGSKPFGNLYCVEKDHLGRPIVKGSEQAKALEQANAKQAEMKEKIRQIKANRPPMSPQKKKMIAMIAGGALAVIIPISYFAFFMTYTHSSTSDNGAKISIDYKSYVSYLTDKVKDGVKREWYPNGKLALEIYYKNDRKDGSFKKWTQEGVLTSEENYKQDRKHGVFKVFNPKGEIRQEESYKDDRKDGVFKYYDHYTGKLSLEKNYKEGKKDGAFKTWNSDGQLQSEEHYKNDLKDGVFKRYGRDGKPYYEENYKDAKRHGAFKKWNFSDGHLEREENYKDDKKDGVFKHYNRDGRPSSEVNYKDGEKHGVSKSWNSNGLLRYESNYADGKQHGVQKSYDYSSGKLIREEHYSYGKRDGSFKQWNSSGVLTSESNYSNGDRHGVQKSYDYGKLASLETYSYGKRDGLYQRWYRGKKVEEGQYSYGNKTGTWKYWDSRGRLTTRQYIFGRLVR